MDPRFVYMPPYYIPPYVQYLPNGHLMPASSANASSAQPASSSSASSSSSSAPASSSAPQVSSDQTAAGGAEKKDEAKAGEPAAASSTERETEAEQQARLSLQEQWLQQVYQQRLAQYQNQLYMYNHFHPYVVHGDQIVYSKATPAQPPAYEQTIRGPPEVIEIEDPSFYEADPWPVKTECPFIII